jgi:cytoskeletal protein CcmA (bactofilin family)
LIDGVNVASSGFRILVKDEANTAHNGIYTYTNGTTLTRATDFDTAVEIAGGDFTFVTGGTTYNSTGWVQIDDVTVVGTDPIIWDQFSGAGEYTAGQGLTLTGTVFSVNVDNITTEISGGNVIVKANAQFTTPNIGAATGTSVDLTGNVLAGNLNSNAKVTAVDFEASGNIIAANISANANLLVNNATVNLELSGNTANFSGNVVIANLHVNTTLSGNVANFSGNLTAANANLGNLIIANFANIASNITTSNLTVNLQLDGNTANFTGNIIALNANLGNLVTANYGNFANDLVVQGNIANANNISVTNLINGNTANFSGNIVSPTFSANTSVVIANTTITTGTLTTSSISANQTIASFNITGVTGIEYLVKGIDSTGSKYSVATVLAVTDGTNADYAIYGSSQLGGYTGSLAVNVVGSTVRLQVTPASSNSTVWTTQYRLI